MKRWLPFVPLVVIALLGMLFAGYALKHDPRVLPQALVGQPVPDLTLPALADGQPVPIKGSGEGPVMINLFASWCAPCAVEQPELMRLKAQGVRIVGVAYKDDPVASRGFLARLGDPFDQVLVDRSGDAGVEFGISGVPETFLVGADGVIFAKHTGPMSTADADNLSARLKLGR